MKDIYITSPYRKLFTPDLNVFLYIKVIYLSFISFISDASERIRVTSLAGCRGRPLASPMARQGQCTARLQARKNAVTGVRAGTGPAPTSPVSAHTESACRTFTKASDGEIRSEAPRDTFRRQERYVPKAREIRSEEPRDTSSLPDADSVVKLSVYLPYFSIRSRACSSPNSKARCRLFTPSSFCPFRHRANPRKRCPSLYSGDSFMHSAAVSTASS